MPEDSPGGGRDVKGRGGEGMKTPGPEPNPFNSVEHPPEERVEIKRLRPEPSVEVPATSFRFSFWWLLALFVAFRWLALLLLRPGGYLRDWSDFDTFLGIAAMSDYGLYPFFDFWLEWPPLVPWMAVGAYKLSLLIPPWPDDYRLWFVLILGSVFVLFEGGNLYLIYRIAGLVYSDAEEKGSEHEGDSVNTPSTLLPDVHARVLRPVWLYTLLFVPLYTLLGFFDAVALFFLLLALYLTLRDRQFGSAVSAALGFVSKITPIIFVPVAIRHIWDTTQDRWEKIQDSALYAVGSLLSIVVLLAPFIFTQPAWLLVMMRAISGRSSWETVWALMEGYTGFGVVAGDRLNAMETGFAVHEASLPWWAITLVFALIYLVVWTRPADYSRARNVVAFTGLTMTLFVMYSKGYSPQFLVYLLPFIVLLLPNRRGALYLLLLTFLNILEQPIYFVLVPEVEQLFVLVLVVRWLVWGALLLEFSYVLWGEEWRLLPVLRRYAPAALSLMFVLGVVRVAPVAAVSYWQQRLTQDPAAPVIGYLKTDRAVGQSDLLLVADRELLRRLSPFLGDRYHLHLLGGASEYAGASSLGTILGESRSVWLLTGGTGVPDSARAELEVVGSADAVYTFAADYRLSLYAAEDESTLAAPLARLSSGADLIGFQVERVEVGQILVTLFWLATDPPDESYTAFVHLVSEDGEFVVGHDSFPLNGTAPTQTWLSGYVYADPHLLEIREDASPGMYELVAGMYDVNMVRAVAARHGASVFEDRAVPLSEISLP
jgi:hypothetical protein